MSRIALLSSIVCPSLLCLMLSSELALSSELYRWAETDGSITFSPTPPPAGTAYEIVGTNSAPETPPVEPALGAATRSSARTLAPIDAGSEASDDGPSPGTLQWQEPDMSNASEPVNGRTDGNRLRPSRQDLPDAALIRASGKDQHCRELAKRVVSLERRLTTRLTPAQMDDTVVYMARYQRNIDQFCPR